MLTKRSMLVVLLVLCALGVSVVPAWASGPGTGFGVLGFFQSGCPAAGR